MVTKKSWKQRKQFGDEQKELSVAILSIRTAASFLVRGVIIFIPFTGYHRIEDAFSRGEPRDEIEAHGTIAIVPTKHSIPVVPTLEPRRSIRFEADVQLKQKQNILSNFKCFKDIPHQQQQ